MPKTLGFLHKFFDCQIFKIKNIILTNQKSWIRLEDSDIINKLNSEFYKITLMTFYIVWT